VNFYYPWKFLALTRPEMLRLDKKGARPLKNRRIPDLSSILALGNEVRFRFRFRNHFRLTLEPLSVATVSEATLWST
jgi:hypothetical protein